MERVDSLSGGRGGEGETREGDGGRREGKRKKEEGKVEVHKS